MERVPTLQRKQTGSMLLEALISILIFSFAILAIVGLQANSIKLSNDAKYRSDASLLASQYIGSMWNVVSSSVGATNSIACTTSFDALLPQGLSAFDSPSGNFFTDWVSGVKAALPNANAVVVTNTAVITPSTGVAACTALTQQEIRTAATITITWQLPGGDVHTYYTSTLLSAQKDN